MLSDFYDSFLANQTKKNEIKKIEESVEKKENDLIERLFPKTDIKYNHVRFIPTYDHQPKKSEVAESDSIEQDESIEPVKTLKQRKTNKTTRSPKTTKSAKVKETKILKTQISDKISEKELNIKKENTVEYIGITDLDIFVESKKQTLLKMEEPLMFSFSDLPDFGDSDELSTKMQKAEPEVKKFRKCATITLKNGKKLISQPVINEDLEFIYTVSDKINKKTIDSIRYI